MHRTVYLHGILKDKFGESFYMNATKYADIINCIDCNRPGFKKFLLESYQQGVGIDIRTAGVSIKEKDLKLPISSGDVNLTIIPAGSANKGIGKILLAAVLIVAGVATGNAATAGPGMKLLGSTLTGIGTNLALAGIQQLLAPDPSEDDEEKEAYLYNGDASLVIEGDPVPILYGKLRVPGQPISIAVYSTSTNAPNITDSNGNMVDASGDYSVNKEGTKVDITTGWDLDILDGKRIG
jgi:predicted phage tail protein